MVRIYDKLHRAVNALEFFTTREWKFSTNNVLMLIDQLKGIDKEVTYPNHTYYYDQSNTIIIIENLMKHLFDFKSISLTIFCLKNMKEIFK